jgi:hypothetical protein
MRLKILGIFVCSLFLLNIGAFAKPIFVYQNENQSVNFDDPVPIWNVDDSWTFTINEFTSNYDTESLRIIITGDIQDFQWTVSEVSSTDYTVDFKGKLTADYFEFFVASDASSLQVTGSMRPLLTRLSGNIVFTKSDLEIKDINAELRGISMAKIAPIPIALPIPFRITLDGELSTVFPVLDFPLFAGKYWALPNIAATMNIEIGGILGLVKIPMTFYTTYPWIPLAFNCKPMTEVTVTAGTFDAYEISSTWFSMFEYYYAPNVKNIVKIDATMPNGNFNGELKSTNVI